MSARRDKTVSKQDTRETAASLLLGASRIRLLSALLLNPAPPLHLRALGRLARVALGLLQRELRTFEEIGLIERIEQGRNVVFGVNRNHPLLPALRDIVIDTAGGLPALLSRQLAGIDVAASIYLHRSAPGDSVVLLIISEVAYDRWVEKTLPLETVLARMILLRVLRPGAHHADIDLMQWQRLPGVGSERGAGAG